MCGSDAAIGCDVRLFPFQDVPFPSTLTPVFLFVFLVSRPLISNLSLTRSQSVTQRRPGRLLDSHVQMFSPPSTLLSTCSPH